MSELGGRSFDVVLFGATGFTGQRAARRLAAIRPEGQRVALAGRREAPLRSLAQELGMDAVVADVGDGSSLAVAMLMGSRTEVKPAPRIRCSCARLYSKV